jgi:hypothetical protein
MDAKATGSILIMSLWLSGKNEKINEIERATS